VQIGEGERGEEEEEEEEKEGKKKRKEETSLISSELWLLLSIPPMFKTSHLGVLNFGFFFFHFTHFVQKIIHNFNFIPNSITTPVTPPSRRKRVLYFYLKVIIIP
jgi:hypothetical protein